MFCSDFLPALSSSGTCTCAAGYKGELCNVRCDEFTAGLGCKLRCPCVKENSEGCDPVNGRCICKPGWRGEFSDIYYIKGTVGMSDASNWSGAL